MTTEKRPSRCEQPGWTGVRDNHEGQAKPAMVVPNRREAGRREQARRDNGEASEPLRTARVDWSEG